MADNRPTSRGAASADLAVLCRRLSAHDATVAVIGLGYVGLPLAIALAHNFRAIGFDIDSLRVDELRAGHDRTAELAATELKDATLTLTADESVIAGADIFIVTVPTPVDANNKPDLRAVRAACAMVGRRMKPGA